MQNINLLGYVWLRSILPRRDSHTERQSAPAPPSSVSMTRRAKERRRERAEEKQRADERREARDRALAGRTEWRQLLAAIDGAVVQHFAQQQQPSPPKPKQIVNELQWKSTHVPIAAASVFQLPIKLDAAKGALQYEFSTRDYDVNFAGTDR